MGKTFKFNKLSYEEDNYDPRAKNRWKQLQRIKRRQKGKKKLILDNLQNEID